MTREDIIRMARESGICTWVVPPQGAVEQLERFAALVAAAEREKHKYWQGLTDEERNEILKALPGGHNTHASTARAIEAALKEKNA